MVSAISPAISAQAEEALAKQLEQARAAAAAAETNLKALRRQSHDETLLTLQQLQREKARDLAPISPGARGHLRRPPVAAPTLLPLGSSRQERAEHEAGLRERAQRSLAEETGAKLAAEEERTAALHSLAASTAREEGEASARLAAEVRAAPLSHQPMMGLKPSLQL